jgi:hypothetical protein
MSNVFSKESIEKVKKFFTENVNAGRKKMPCINTVNKAIEIVYNEKFKLGTQMDHSMKALGEYRKVVSSELIEFIDINDKITKGILEPVKLSRNLFDA